MVNVIKFRICNTLTILPLNMNETICFYAQGCKEHKVSLSFLWFISFELTGAVTLQCGQQRCSMYTVSANVIVINQFD